MVFVNRLNKYIKYEKNNVIFFTGSIVALSSQSTNLEKQKLLKKIRLRKIKQQLKRK
jgi:hypothetical protein